MLALASASNLPHRTLRYNLAAEPGFQRTFAIGCRDEEGSFVLGHVHPWGNIAMICALPCHHSEDILCSWNREEDAAVMAKVIWQKVIRQKIMGA
jgi:hypothetical protein